MAKYVFTAEGNQLISKLTPDAGDVQERERTYVQPSFKLALNEIKFFESGVYDMSLRFEEFGTIGSETPADLPDALHFLKVLVANFSGGGGSPQALISEDDGNQIIEGNDGKLFAGRKIKEVSDTDYVFIEEDKVKYLFFAGLEGTATLGNDTFAQDDEIVVNVFNQPLEFNIVDDSDVEVYYNGTVILGGTIDNPIFQPNTILALRCIGLNVYTLNVLSEPQIVTTPYTPNAVLVSLAQTNFPTAINVLIHTVTENGAVVDKALWSQSAIGEDVVFATAGTGNMVQLIGDLYSAPPTLTLIKKYQGFISQEYFRYTSGDLVVGEEYLILDYVSGDDFENVGGENFTGSTFTATDTTPTVWANASTLLNRTESKIVLTDFDNSLGYSPTTFLNDIGSNRINLVSVPYGNCFITTQLIKYEGVFISLYSDDDNFFYIKVNNISDNAFSDQTIFNVPIEFYTK